MRDQSSSPFEGSCSAQKVQLEAIVTILDHSDRNLWPSGFFEDGELSLTLLLMPRSFKPTSVSQRRIDAGLSMAAIRAALRGPGADVVRILPPEVTSTFFFGGTSEGRIELSDNSARLEYRDPLGEGDNVAYQELRKEPIEEVRLADLYASAGLAEVFDGSDFIGLEAVWSEAAARTPQEAHDHLAARVAERETSLPVMGIKVPYTGLQKIAPVILVGNIIYLMAIALHIRSIRSTSAEELETFPWLLISKSAAARRGIAMATVVLTTITPLIVTWYAPQNERAWLWALTSSTTLLVLTVVLVRVCQSLVATAADGSDEPREDHSESASSTTMARDRA